jgi:hypothetical protein
VTHDPDEAAELAAVHAAVEGRTRYAAADDDETCGLCGRWPRDLRHHDWCERCRRDLGVDLRRRREAELRLPPLDRGPS